MVGVSTWTPHFRFAVCGSTLAAGKQLPFIVAQSLQHFLQLRRHSRECRAGWSTHALGFCAEVRGFAPIGQAWITCLTLRPQGRTTCQKPHIPKWKLRSSEKRTRRCQERRAEGKGISGTGNYLGVEMYHSKMKVCFLHYYSVWRLEG